MPFFNMLSFFNNQFADPSEDGGDDLARIKLAYDATLIESFPLLC